MTAALARQTAFSALSAIERQGAYTHLALRSALLAAPHSTADAGLASEIVHGVTVWRRLLDYWIADLTKGGTGHLEHAVRTLLRMSLYQTRFLVRVPAYAAVSDAVELAKTHAPKATRFVNGVLRAALRQSDYLMPARAWQDVATCCAQEAALRLSYPDWLALRLIDTYGFQAAVAAMAAMNESPLRTLRVNRLRAQRDEVVASLAARGLEAQATSSSLQGIRLLSRTQAETLPEITSGLCTLQGESSMLVAAVLAPKPGEDILDACAAPGGKATHLAEYSDDLATITALDLHDHRARMIAGAARRLGLKGVRAVTGDARDWTGEYDAVLLDAPCSGLGTIARKSDLKWTSAPGKITAIVALQAELLSAMAKRVKPGGRLLYTTCTLVAEENEDQRERFLKDHPDFEPLPFTLGQGQSTPPLTRAGADGQALIMPQDFGGDGFYLALFRRARPS